jgi:hypothetical protein
MVTFTMSAIRNDMTTLNPSARDPDIDQTDVSSFQQCRHVKFAPTVTRGLIVAGTLVGLPWVYDAVVVAVEEGGVLLHHAHVVVPVVVVRRAVRVVDVRRRQSSRQVCADRRQLRILILS